MLYRLVLIVNVDEQGEYFYKDENVEAKYLSDMFRRAIDKGIVAPDLTTVACEVSVGVIVAVVSEDKPSIN